MAITYTSVHSEQGRPYGGMGGAIKGAGTFVGPASYTSGGEALDIATEEGLTNDPFDVQIEEAQANATRTYDCRYDYTNQKVVIYNAGTTSQSSGDLSGATFKVTWKAIAG